MVSPTDAAVPGGALQQRPIRVAGRRMSIAAPRGDFVFERHRDRNYREHRYLCETLLGPDGTVVDVGANIGLTALIAARAVPRGRVLAIEAAPNNFAALSRNLSAHAPTVATALHCAVGSGPGEVRFIENSAFGHVQTEANMLEARGAAVPQRALDAIVDDHALDRVDFVKIDVEGYEQQVLSGAERTIDRFDPVFFLEFNTLCQIALYDGNPRTFITWLLDRFADLYVWRGYRLVSVHELGAFRFLQAHLIQHRGFDNLLAARSAGRLGDLARRTEKAGMVERLRRQVLR